MILTGGVDRCAGSRHRVRRHYDDDVPERFSPSQILKDLRTGPSGASAPTAHQVAVAATKYPPQFSTALRALFYSMTDAVLRHPHRDELGRYASFSRPWRGDLASDDASYYFGSLDAYQVAISAGLLRLDWASDEPARAVAQAMNASVPEVATVEGLAWRVLLGQVQSIYDRDEAASTFSEVRDHPKASLVSSFFRDLGAMTYYSDEEVQRRKRGVPTLSQMGTWTAGAGPQSDRAILISVDPKFFRIYGPMILHNAQQLSTLDFVIVLCSSAEIADQLHRDAQEYLTSLSALNRQSPPKNVRFIAVDTPHWVANERTFFAAARFLALPGLLEEYESVYAMDADLFMVRNPGPFMNKTAGVTLGVPRTEGTLGISPWRRYMAGNVVANRSMLASPACARLLDYLSVGLADSASWMLDQNALTYAVEGVADYQPLTTPRPMIVGNFMAQWERNG